MPISKTITKKTVLALGGGLYRERTTELTQTYHDKTGKLMKTVPGEPVEGALFKPAAKGAKGVLRYMVEGTFEVVALQRAPEAALKQANSDHVVAPTKAKGVPKTAAELVVQLKADAAKKKVSKKLLKKPVPKKKVAKKKASKKKVPVTTAEVVAEIADAFTEATAAVKAGKNKSPGKKSGLGTMAAAAAAAMKATGVPTAAEVAKKAAKKKVSKKKVPAPPSGFVLPSAPPVKKPAVKKPAGVTVAVAVAAAKAPVKLPKKPKKKPKASKATCLADLTTKEHRVLGWLLNSSGPQKINDIRAGFLDFGKAFGCAANEAQASSWVRNSLRKLTKLQLVYKVERGTYALTAKGKAWLGTG